MNKQKRYAENKKIKKPQKKQNNVSKKIKENNELESYL